MCGSLIFDFAPMLHRFCQAAVPVVLSDEPLDVGPKLELATACTRVIGPEKRTPGDGLVLAIDPQGVVGRGATKIFAPQRLRVIRVGPWIYQHRTSGNRQHE